jgi:hypothetical protein
MRSEKNNLVVSFPKSGRTWLRVMIGFITCKKLGIDESKSLESALLRSLCPSYPLFLHDGINRGWSKLVEDEIASHENDRVLYLHRDIRDVMASYYFHRVHREKDYHRGISDFIRDDRWGVVPYLEFHSSWMKNNGEIMTVRYEDIQSDCENEIARIIEYFGIRVDSGIISDSVEFGSFKRMREMEVSGFLGRRMLSPKNKKDIRSYKTRSGKIGDHANHMGIDDLEYIKNKEEEYGIGK